MKNLSSTYIQKTIEHATTATIRKSTQAHFGLAMRVMVDNKLVLEIPFEYLYDMLTSAAISYELPDENNSPGLKRRLNNIYTMLRTENEEPVDD